MHKSNWIISIHFPQVIKTYWKPPPSFCFALNRPPNTKNGTGEELCYFGPQPKKKQNYPKGQNLCWYLEDYLDMLAFLFCFPCAKGSSKKREFSKKKKTRGAWDK